MVPGCSGVKVGQAPGGGPSGRLLTTQLMLVKRKATESAGIVVIARQIHFY